MQKRIWAIIALAVVAGVVFLLVPRDGEDQSRVDELVRQQAVRSTTVADKPAKESQRRSVFHLTDTVVAEADVRGTWLVKQPAGPDATVVRLPFRPSGDGRKPEAKGSSLPDSAFAPKWNPGYLGAQSCAECHQDKHAGFIHTAHHRTSGVATAEEVAEYFDPSMNTLKTEDENLSFTMLQRDDEFVQRVSLADWKLDVPLDVFTGSAKSGRTFLYWHGNALYQAHISYLSGHNEWITSPGYRATDVHYTREIRTECLECHVTFISLRAPTNLYHRDSAIWGISCERCHGPGRQHVEFHRENPEEKESRHIVHPGDLPRQRQLDLCGQCHSGEFALLRRAFTYRPGEDLALHHEMIQRNADGVGGIHTSNQLTRLEMSRCFQESEMTCATCHNPHQNQRGNTAAFTRSCLNCHESEHCGMSARLGPSITDNCISCHMPKGDTEQMTMQVSSGEFTLKMIDHFIRIDQEATDALLSEDDGAN